MPEYFIPKTEVITLPSGVRHVVVRGIREIPNDLADSQVANLHGIKPPHEMTDAECDDLGVSRVPKTVLPAPEIKAAAKVDVPVKSDA